jgi:hypothetical protein
MALKFMVDSLDGMAEDIKALYEPKGDKFQLKVEGLPAPDNTDWETRLSKLEAKNRELIDEKRKAKEEADRAARESAMKSGDVAEIEKSWQEKYDKDIAALKEESGGKLKSFESLVNDLTVGSTATSIAAEVFGEHAELMMPHITKRLGVEVTDGQAKIRVKGLDGKPTAMTAKELAEELRNNEKMAPFVVGCKASGAGSHGKGGNGQPKKFAEYTGAELTAIRRDNPKEYDRLKKDHYGET